MRKYIISAKKNGRLHLYTDAEFAAVMWKDVELDSFESDDESEIVTIPVKVGDKFEVEIVGFEFVDSDLINLLNITQIFGESDMRRTTISYEAWVPADLLNLRSLNSENFQITKCD